ncbi:hypothetical protein CWI39_0092p0010 [Hamiltosporidium magnivora]|uniref:Uncharacterized protein n=1 Tax=Hamiltosporidium magnivora TaxID=148818 RepID=A0A4Q9LMR3_9MICR|nr:hypothetical protein CWI39_0092p0010 [Hamiltosporidium magnivora]
MYFKSRKLRILTEKNRQRIFWGLIIYICSIYSTAVSFFVINDKSCIFDFIANDSILETSEQQNNSVNSIHAEEKITFLKNDIIRVESYNTNPKFYNSYIVTIPYKDSMLLNSKYIKDLFVSDAKNIRICFKNVSYTGLLLFLKLIDNPDVSINQMKIQDFLEILMFLTILDIQKSKERDGFLKEILRNIIFSMANINSNFDYKKYSENCGYESIKKCIFRDLFIFFIDTVTFKSRRTQNFMVFSEIAALSINSPYIYFSSKEIPKNNSISKFYLRFEANDIENISKIIEQEYLIKTWIFLNKIANIDILYLIFNEKSAYKKAIILFSNVTFHSENLYIHSYENPIKLFMNKNVTPFSKKLKVLKLKCNFTTEEIRKLLNVCKSIREITLKTIILDFEILGLLIDFFIKNPDKYCKVFCTTYIFLGTTIQFIRKLPNNLSLHAINFQKGSDIVNISLEYMPFFQTDNYYYIHTSNSIIPNKFVFLELSNFKNLTLNYKNCSSPYKLDCNVFTPLKYFKTIKYFTLQNIVICDELLLYFLESNTIVLFRVIDFVCNYSLKFLENNDTYNRKLENINFINSLSYFDFGIMIYLSRFERVVGLKLIDISINSLKIYFKNIFNNILGSKFKVIRQIYLLILKITTKSSTKEKCNIFKLIYETYEISDLVQIEYCVYEITETDYYFFSKMKNLKVISIAVRNRSKIIEFCKLLYNYEPDITINALYINVSKIQKNDIEAFKKLNKLSLLSLLCDTIDYETVSRIKKSDFKKTAFKIQAPVRANRSVEINTYLDSEFRDNFL